MKYKIDINWKDIEKGRPYKPHAPLPSPTPLPSVANALADIFTTASTTLAEEVTQDFANDNTRLKLVLSIKPPPPKLSYYSTFTVTSNQPIDEDKKQELNKEILQAIANAQEKLALQLQLDMVLDNDKLGDNRITFRNISNTQRAKFDVELNRQIPGIINEVCNSLGYQFEWKPNTLPPFKPTPFRNPLQP